MTDPALRIRVEDASLGSQAQVRLVLHGVVDADKLRSAWASSGAVVDERGGRLHAVTSVDALARAAGRTLPEQTARALDESLRVAVESWSGPAPAVQLPQATLSFDAGPLLMGVVNVTPDSFSDGGELYPDGHPQAGIEHGRRLLADGATILDCGGESTRPGADAVDLDEELQRVVPVVEGLAGDGVVLSVDTTKPEVAAAALEAGATVLNDVSGARDPELLAVASEHGAGYVLMHARGRPKDMQSKAQYEDVVAEVFEYLADGLERCEQAGIPAQRIIVDPGLGFAKQPEHNVALLAGLRQLRSLGRPVLVGASRKSFMGALLGDSGAHERLEGSLACAAVATLAGVAVLRVHDVEPTAKVVKVAQAIADAAQ